MSDSPEPPSRGASRAIVPVFATAAYFAGLVALWGFTSLILRRDPVDYPDAGLLLGPVMVASACAVTFIGAYAVRRSAPLAGGLLTAITAFAVVVLTGAVGYATVRADFGWIPAAAVHFAISPYIIGAAILAGIIVTGTALVAKSSPG